MIDVKYTLANAIVDWYLENEDKEVEFADVLMFLLDEEIEETPYADYWAMQYEIRG